MHNVLTNQFKYDRAAALVGGSYKIALYTDASLLDKDTTQYSTTGELSNASYPAGGLPLTLSVDAEGNVTASDVTFPSLSGEFSGALIYNTATGNSVGVIHFGYIRHNATDFTLYLSRRALIPISVQ